MKKTGGGVGPPELQPWEISIRDSLPQAVIAGIDGGVDTDEQLSWKSESAVTLPIVSCNETGACTSGTGSMDKITKADSNYNKIAVTPAVLETNKPSCSYTCKGTTSEAKEKEIKAKKRPIQNSDSSTLRLLEIQVEKLGLLKEMVDLKKQKIKILEDISHQLKKKECSCSEELAILSPVIKF